MIILEYLKMLAETGCLTAAAFVLIALFVKLCADHRRCGLSERLRKMEEMQRGVLEKLDQCMRACKGNEREIEWLKRDVAEYQRKKESVVRGNSGNPGISNSYDEYHPQNRNPENGQKKTYQGQGSDIAEKKASIQGARLTERQRNRRIKPKAVKGGWGEDELFMEDSGGVMSIISEQTNLITVEPAIEELSEANFKYCGISKCFETNQNVISGQTYKINNIKKACVLEKSGEYYRVKEKGIIEIILR